MSFRDPLVLSYRGNELILRQNPKCYTLSLKEGTLFTIHKVIVSYKKTTPSFYYDNFFKVLVQFMPF